MAETLQLRREVGSEPAQLIGIDGDSTVKLTVQSTVVDDTSRKALPTGAVSVVLSSDVDCFYNLGGSTVDAGDTKIPLYSRQPMVFSLLSGQTHIAVQHDSNSGSAWVSKADVP